MRNQNYCLQSVLQAEAIKELLISMHMTLLYIHLCRIANLQTKTNTKWRTASPLLFTQKMTRNCTILRIFLRNFYEEYYILLFTSDTSAKKKLLKVITNFGPWININITRFKISLIAQFMISLIISMRSPSYETTVQVIPNLTLCRFRSPNKVPMTTISSFLLCYQLSCQTPCASRPN